MTTMTTEMAGGALARIVNEAGLVPANAQALIDAFAPLAQQADALVRDAKGIEVTDATQVSAMKEAGRQRRAIKDVRCEAEKVRKAQKADYLKMGRLIDSIGAYIAGVCEPEEARLEACEKFAERAEAARLDALAAERCTALRPILDDLPPSAVVVPDLRTMPAAAWTQYLADATAARKARDDARAAAEKAAREKAEAEAAERRRLAEEHARMKAERDAAEKARMEAEAAARAEREEAERKLAEERAARDRAEETANMERRAREKAERERAAAEAKEKAKAEAAARKAAAAPDAVKLRAIVGYLASVPAPEMKTEEGRFALRRSLNMIRDVGVAIGEMADGIAGGAA